jgi:glutaminyl-tRNA synthetase
MVDVGLLEFCVREHLNKVARRRMVVFDPVKVLITNYQYTGPGQEIVHVENNPEDPSGGHREVSFSNELWIERDDFMEVPSKKYFRLGPGLMVRLKSAYIIRCDEVIKDAGGKITELHCSYFPESHSGNDTSGIKVKGTLHWVNAKEAIGVEVREYDRLFKVEDAANEEGDFKEYINTDSLKIVKAFAEPAILLATLEDRFQFLRKGYYCLDKDSRDGRFIFNRTVTLKDGWSKEQKK